MTIRLRLIYLSIVAVLGSLIIGSLGLYELSSSVAITNSIYNDRVVPLRDLKVIADMYAVNVVDTSHKARNGNISYKEAIRNVADAQKVINEKWNAYLATFLVPEEEAVISVIKPMLSDVNKSVSMLMDILKREDSLELSDFTITKLYSNIYPISEQFNKLIEVQLDVAKNDYEKMQNAYSFAKIVIIVLVLVVLIVISVFSTAIIRSVFRSTSAMETAMQSIVQKGLFSNKVEIFGNDEMAVISRNFNLLLDSLSKVVTETNQVVSALSAGDLTKRITGDYVGDLALLKQGVNNSANNIDKVMIELSGAMSALQIGDFKKQLNTNAQGQYGKMLVDASSAMNSFNQVITEIIEVMHQMSEGDFNSRVNTKAQGSLLAMKNNINSSMDAMARAIHAISEVVIAQAQGDLTKELPSGTFKGQLHDLKNAINFSSAKVKESVIQAIDASNIVNEAAMQVSQGSSDLSGRVQEQAAALEQTSATMNEMATAVQANTQNAKRVAELAHQVQHQAGAGVEVMQQTISAMQSIKESSSKIADIVTLIDGIAFQTNLLALNAAVEAARAGEHGRGFAVVAGEVRALAQKSADAAKDIKDLISDSVGRIEAGTHLADKSGEMLSGITGSIEQVAGMIEQIANASAEQTAGIGQVHRAIADIDRVTQENAALVEETTAAAESLSTEANHLKENMSFFKTGSSSQAHYVAKPVHAPVKKLGGGLPAPSKQNSGEWSHF